MSQSPDNRSLLSASSQLNLMEVESIDDKEFDIPQVDTPPTLESILSQMEEEEDPFVLEDTCILNTDNMDAQSCDTSSLASSDSGDPAHLKRHDQTQKPALFESSLSLLPPVSHNTMTTDRKRRPLDQNPMVHGSVLRLSLLKGISAQIVAATDKVDAGLPTAITMSGVIAVGTSHGLALVFDTNQALRLCLGSKTTGAEFGAVSALSINHDCSRLLCGFAKGQITMWDLANGKLLRTITDAHPPGTAILHVKFTDDPTLAVCNDSGGSVFELTFRRVMGMRSCDSRCLFSGSKGEVCCIEPLRTPPDFRDHPITCYSLLAMASLTKILVIGLKPTLNVWMTLPYTKSDPTSVPQLAWQFVPIQKMVNPVLAFCKGETVHFLLVKKEETGTIHVIKQRQLQLSCDIISLNWINSGTLVLVDSHEKLHVVDRPSQEVLETLDLEQVQLVYNSRHFKSLATGGNVSQALALVGEKACYQSLSSYAGQIICLGTKSAHILSLRNWKERLDCLLKQEHFTEALPLAWSFHEGKAKAVVGLHGDSQRRKAVISDKMVEILLQFTEYALKKCPEQGKLQVMEQHFQDMVPILVDYCLLLQKADLLFNQLYSRLVENMVAKGVFLESLESYIIANRLGHITTPVMKDLLAHYHDNGMMDSLERCIVHLDVTSLDIQQVVQVCWSNQLYDAVIYIFNRGMNDYITPMEKLFSVIGPRVREGRSLTGDDVVMGNKLLVYISCCLAGRAYPIGDIPEDLVVQVKNQVFEFLIRLHSGDSSQKEEVFPFIHTLLHFDTREFLNVLAMTFDDVQNDKQALEYQQRIVDMLLQVMVENPDFTPSQVGGLFTFLARQLAKPNNTLFVNRNLFDQVLEFLCCPDDDSRHTERQQVLLELLQVGGMVQFNEERLFTLAEKAKFYQICEFLYEKKLLYDLIVDCYLQDPLRKSEVFSYIHNLMSMPGYSSEEKLKVKHKVLQHMQELVSLDPGKLADLVVWHFKDEVQSIISELQNDQLLFQFLSCLLEPQEGSQSAPRLPLESELYELLLELMCRFEPQELLKFLHTSQHYRLEEAIQITEKYHCNDANAYLLEKKGDIHGAFAGLLQTLKERLHVLAAEMSCEFGGGADRRDEEEVDGDLTLMTVKSSLNQMILFCHRNCQNLDQEQRKDLWFPLLDTMMASQKEVMGLSDKHISDGLKEMTLKVMNCMSSFISLPAIIQQILQDPVYGRGKLAEIQGLILGMLDTFTYEQTLLETTTSLLNHDLHWSLAHLRSAVTRGLHPRQDCCNICLQHYKRKQDASEEIIVFSCGHLYHLQCLQQKDCGWGQTSELQPWRCYKCSSSHRGRASAEPNRSRSASLAQTCFSSGHHEKGAETHRKKVFAVATMDLQQELSWDHLRGLYRGPSRLSILSEVSHGQGSEKTSFLIPAQPGTEHFPLKLAPPPLFED
ncbi:vacuolar protein sorting-associated protein 8 homolog isoform X2 [Girardinichthys multiradiatus]|uniref:vacuolar protein sorting-associated protein 8 homolog isoform X2 n=1 Tax=Girardinichthys multiradiatus TaxID=208333 RepID=UPI001FACAF29|nr:vacuolar protein sorting-associated protein 8 homolog isoform X2 [Girardinichthys multiradiatus]